MIYYIDIDETICFYKEERDYQEAIPIKDNIKKINMLYESGHQVVYWTARGSTTGKDWTELTTTQLKKWGAKYHEIKLGKPHYDFFIDDKAVNSGDFFKKSKT
jgi:dTDP-glucose 4,6-dehydratase